MLKRFDLPVAAAGGPTVTTRPEAAPGVALLLGVFLLSLGTGLENALLALRAGLAGFGTVFTGLLMVAYYAGFLAGAVAVPAVVERVGHIRVFAALASVASAAVLLHGQLVALPVWLVLRLVSGGAVAGLLVVAESWLNAHASNVTRGRLLSLYAVVLMGGLGAGPLLLNVASLTGPGLFVLASLLLSLALVPVVLGPHPEPRIVEAGPVPVGWLLDAVPLGVVVSVLVGVAHGMLLGMGAVYARAAGLGVAGVSLFLTVTVLASTLTQLPLGALSDRVDRRVVIGGLGLGAGGPAVLAAVLAGRADAAFFAAAALFGALSLPLYSLGVAHANDWLSPEQRVSASATLVRLNGAGLAAGPLVAAAGLEAVGPAGFFLIQALLHLGLAAFAAYRVARVPAGRGSRRHTPLPARGVALWAVLLPGGRRLTGRTVIDRPGTRGGH